MKFENRLKVDKQLFLWVYAVLLVQQKLQLAIIQTVGKIFHLKMYLIWVGLKHGNKQSFTSNRQILKAIYSFGFFRQLLYLVSGRRVTFSN